jgi:hypothetical protein
MIHIIEIDAENRAKVWFAFDEADLIRKVKVAFASSKENIIFEQTTPAKLLAENHIDQQHAKGLAEQFGMTCPLYRADYLLGHGTYQAETISELRASLAAIASAEDFRVYTSDEDAADELDRDPIYQSKLGFDAGIKLRAQLVEMEVIAEDF